MILHTRWDVSKKPEKKVEKKLPEKKKFVEPKVEEKPVAPAVEDPTAEEFIATLPKKKREVKKVNIDE